MIKKIIKKRELLVSKHHDNNIEIPLEYSEGINVSNKYFAWLEEVYELKLTAEEKKHIIDKRRRSGFCFDDDPLKGKYIIFDCNRRTLDEIVYGINHLGKETKIIFPPKKHSILDPLPEEIFTPISLKENFTEIKEIDDQHEEFERILDYVLTHQDLIKIFEKIDKYMKKNFSYEEKYFDEFNYKNAEKHKDQHQMFKVKLANIGAKCLEDKIEGISELISFLNDWQYNHNLISDSKYIQCFKNHGLE
jgi:hemerythrin-like metal-binding protein